MPKYIVTAPSFINGIFYAEEARGALHKVGDEVEYDGEPGSNLQPVGKAAMAVMAALKQTPKPVADLLAKVRMHAATRGVTPDEANEDDINEIVSLLPNKPSDETLAAVRAALAPVDANDLS